MTEVETGKAVQMNIDMFCQINGQDLSDSSRRVEDIKTEMGCSASCSPFI